MKKIYLSPSFQERNIGVGNYGTEEERCNQIADVVEKELKKNKEFVVIRNNPNMSLSEVIADSNKSDADVHFSIHTNSGESSTRGCEVYAYAPNTKGDKLAQIVYRRLVAISPVKGRGVKYDNLAETRQTKMVAVLTEVGFHSNIDDANWIMENIEKIGLELALSLYEYFQLPYENVKEETDISYDGKINSIYDIQEYLNAQYNAGLALDNMYGSKTKSALIKALQMELNRQYKKGLVEDGIFGTKTYKACINVRKGGAGNITRLIQMCLWIKGYAIGIDGMFGTNTQNIVKQFQASNNLSVDGIVGKNTFRKLFE